MPVLKYKDENGNYQPIVGVNVQNEVVQTTGNSTTAVMSQKAISDLIPAQATKNNKLADKDFVNSSITTATATYRGNYNLVSDLELTIQASHGTIEQALNTTATGADNNDYSFVQIPTSNDKPTEIAKVERYKYNGTTWSYEYAINNSGFTAAQWAAVNSNITSGLVAKLNAMSGTTRNSIANLFGMDANGNFQNISTGDLASVLGDNLKLKVYKFNRPGRLQTINTNVKMYGLFIIGMNITDQINMYFGTGRNTWAIKYEGGAVKWQTDNAGFINLNIDSNECLTIKDVDNGSGNWTVYIIKIGLH